MTEFKTKSGMFSRRGLLKAGAAAGAVGVASPWIIRGSMASSGELNFIGWAGYDEFPAVFKAFEAKTGIKVNFTGFGSQDEMVAQARTGAATNGSADMAEPTADRLPSWTDNDFVQPWDESKINLAGVDPAFLQGGAANMTMLKGKRIGATSVWGSEALAFNAKEAPLVFGKAKLMDLFDDKYAGKLTLRAHSGLVAIGRALDAEGKLPHKFLESYTDEAKMAANYDAILKFALSKRKNVAQFWSNENEAQGAFRTNGCVIGHSWDTTAGALMKEGFPIGYIAPDGRRDVLAAELRADEGREERRAGQCLGVVDQHAGRRRAVGQGLRRELHHQGRGRPRRRRRQEVLRGSLPGRRTEEPLVAACPAVLVRDQAHRIRQEVPVGVIVLASTARPHRRAVWHRPCLQESNSGVPIPLSGRALALSP